ncbi:OB-fold-containig protein [Pontibacter akesuensis]|uniref:DUF1449 family protein n=1 Tax=Pontibacter akesuensis TaxID=388950 RepID=A0A1I7K6A8_9BACT|nr:OB-fold-containig protein [Pontibacter akesuensis]GHA74736.1 hypothetical protein GCM10007389_30640 [Pontibacter akesuensis]SFU92948.1 hypothetical protein SAMN04487941_3442 [Pontibacter akesuensis]
MTELLQAAFSSVNIIPTAFLVFVLLYWVAVIFGLLDLDFFNVEIEADLALDSGVDADGVSAVSWLNHALAFFNLGRIPLMLFLTFVALPFWVISILANYYLLGNVALLGWLLLLPMFILSLFVSKILTTPFVHLYAVLEKEHPSSVTIIGQVCTVILPTSTTELGQASVPTSGAPLLLNVKSTRGSRLSKGQTALVIDYNAENKFYLIEPYETI